jgi:hypothetical protein
MDYELAKELKDAGFPQDGTNYTPDHGGDLESAAYYPSLSELIEVCGDEGFMSLTKGEDGDSGRVLWFAYQDFAAGKVVNAPTAEEAVARLWLALNNKDAPQNPATA